MGNGKGAPAGMTSMDEILSFQQQVKYLLYKISRNGAHPVPLDAVSDYKEAEAVPPEKRARLLRDLRERFRRGRSWVTRHISGRRR